MGKKAYNHVLSDKAVEEMKKNGPQYQRKVLTNRRTFTCTPELLFSLLCPTTEYDWIDGWHCEMIYSKSHYHESNAMFRTSFFQMEELFVVTRFEPSKAIEFVRFSEHLTIKLEVAICDNLNGTCTGNWTIVATAVSSEGNNILSRIDSKNEPIAILIDALEYYINNNEIKKLPEGVFNKKS